MGFYFVWRLCLAIHFYNISWVYPKAGSTADDRDSSFTQCWASIIPCFNAYIPSPRSIFQSSWPLIPCSQNSPALKENLGNPSAVEHSWASRDELTFFFHFLFSEVLTFLSSKIHSVSRLYLCVFQTLSLRYNFRTLLANLSAKSLKIWSVLQHYTIYLCYKKGELLADFSNIICNNFATQAMF